MYHVIGGDTNSLKTITKTPRIGGEILPPNIHYVSYVIKCMDPSVYVSKVECT